GPARAVARSRWLHAPDRPRSRRTRLTAVADRADRRPRAHPALRPPRGGHHTRPVATHDGRVEGPGPPGPSTRAKMYQLWCAFHISSTRVPHLPGAAHPTGADHRGKAGVR